MEPPNTIFPLKFSGYVQVFTHSKSPKLYYELNEINELGPSVFNGKPLFRWPPMLIFNHILEYRSGCQ